MDRKNTWRKVLGSQPRSRFVFWPVMASLAVAGSLLLVGQTSSETPETAWKCPYLEKRAACLRDLTGTLDLTEEQVARLEQIRSEHREDMSNLKEALREKRTSLNELFRDPQASERQIRDTEKAWAELKAETREKTLDARLLARSVLTPEQIRAIPPGHKLGIGWTGPTCKCPMEGKVRQGWCPRAKGSES